jgi:tetratricopeptide (TPR) repeat protein/tRNA A-37 threonylcarbamoyl transferase component Bud32
MSQPQEPTRSTGGPPDRPEPSVLDLLATRIGETPRVTLREEDSAAASSPVIDPGAQDRTAVPVGRSNYQFLGEIARGGMGVILKGHDTDLGRDVAVKVLDQRLANRPEVVQRFVEEAQIGGQLQHPGIVPVYELGTMKDQRPFFTMKLVKGRTLATLLTERESPSANRQRLIAVFESVCQTMAYAHSRGVVHRDLKPANIMVGAFGEVQVVDWGLAKVLARGGTADEKRAEQARSHLTVLETVRSSKGSSSGTESMVGSVLGTPAYMPPEQASGHVDRLDERADVFALGAILCEILTGLPPYTGERDEILAAAALADCEGALARLDACGADPELVKLTRQCLMPAAAARPANAGVLADRLHKYIVSVEERAHAAQVESAAARVRVEEERKARRLTAALGAAVVAVLVVGGGGWLLVQKERTAREPEESVRITEKAARDAKLATEVGDALAEAAEHRGGGRWAPALAAVDRAKALAEAGGGAEFATRVESVAAELKREQARAEDEAKRLADNRTLLTELLEAREPIWDSDRDNPARAALRFVEVFRAHGLELDLGTPEDVAAALADRGLGSETALFLDSLTAARRQARDSAGTARALDVAHALDPDPLRADLREALAAEALDVLRGIADSGFSDQPAITIELLGAALQQLGDREAARRVYRTGIDRYPADFGLHYRLGRLLTPPELDGGLSDDLREAVVSYRAALALRPDSTVLRYFLGRMYFKLFDYPRAIEQFTIALGQRPGDPTFLFHLGLNHMSAGQLDEAEAALGGLLDLTTPDWVAGWAASVLGRCQLARGRAREAIALFERALASNPAQAQFQGGLIDAVLASGSVEERDRLLETSLAQYLDNAETLNNIAWGLASTPNEAMRDLERAVTLARRSIELQPTDATWNTLGVALYYSGDLSGSIDALRESVRLQGAGNVVDWLFLAMAHKRLGNAGEARSWYDRALGLMNSQAGRDPEVARFRAEADRLFIQ